MALAAEAESAPTEIDSTTTWSYWDSREDPAGDPSAGEDAEPETEVPVEQTNISLSVGADETQMNFTWYANVSGTGTLTLAKGDDLVNGAMPAEAKSYTAEGTASNKTGYSSYQTSVSGLEPDTVYAYQLTNGDTSSEVYTFTTGSSNDAFSFAFVGDPQIGAGSTATDIRGWDETLNVIGTSDEFQGVSFLLSAGDQVNTADNETQYDGYLDHGNQF